MMLTARDTELDTVTALDAGADDYLSKPFGMMEMVSRVRALLRRSKAAPAARGPSRTCSRWGRFASRRPARGVRRRRVP